MNLWSVVLKSVQHYWQVHLATLLAVAVTSTVLTGALTVGDSMRGSLRDLTMQRLGPIDHIVLSSSMMDYELATRWEQTAEYQQAFDRCIPALHFPAATVSLTAPPVSPVSLTAPSVSPVSLTAPSVGPNLQTPGWTSVAVWGVDARFTTLNWDESPIPLPGANEVVLNQRAAQQLGLTESDLDSLLTLRIGKPSDVPTESFIATKDDTVTSLPRLKLIAIVPDRGVGRLGLSPTTEVTANVFLGLETLQRVIPTATRTARQADLLVNALLLTARTNDPVAAADVANAFRTLRPSLIDAGLKLTHVKREPLDYYTISSVRMLIDEGQQKGIAAALQGWEHQRVLTYLANDLQKSESQSDGIPFSMVTAFDPNTQFSIPLVDGRTLSELADDEIVLNEWAVDNLGVQVGDSIRLKYYEPETVDGNEVEREVVFRLVGVARLTTPSQPYLLQRRELVPPVFDQPPTAANDPWLTPEVPGITDAASIEAWDLPFATAGKIRPQDDDYWQYFRTTPKGFVSLAAGKEMWGSRFGELTGYRLPADSVEWDELQQKLEDAISENVQQVGFQVMPVKRQGLFGSQGSTPFDILFLMFSMFVIVSALLLLVLFVRLGMQQRAVELGVWLAIGFASRRVTRFWWWESVPAVGGGLLSGAVGGVAYAGLMAWLMRTAWVGAVASPFLHLHWTWRSILLGGCASFLICSVVVWWSIRQAAHIPARSLLSGRWGAADGQRPEKRWWSSAWARLVLLVFAVGCSVGGLFTAGDMQAVAFMMGGMGTLGVALLYIYARLVQPTPLSQLQWSDVGRLNLSRQPLRSLMIVGLVAIATFLILAVSAFRLSPSERGTAGFRYVVRTDIGVLDDLNSAEVRTRLLSQSQVSGEPLQTDSDLRFYPFRFADGEHASCNNPFQAGQPQVLGVAPAFVARFDDPNAKPFAWVGHTASDSATRQNPWQLLHQQADSEPIPVIIDKNTAWYSLKVYLPGSKFKIDYPGIGEVEFLLVGLLDNSVLQGALLISQANFLKLFPNQVGSRYFLVAGDEEEELQGLGAAMRETGWQIRRTEDELANYLAVQNTYLSAFQSLGSLGLLLGTIGLVVAQFRSLLERRRELALLQAIGFPLRRIQVLVTQETLILMGLGFGAGLAGAAVGVLPHFIMGAAELPIVWVVSVVGVIGLIGWLAAKVVGGWAVQGNLLRLLRNH